MSRGAEPESSAPVEAFRPARLVVVFGTGTEVGKTWVSARTLAALREHGVSVAARKPAQSFDPADPHPTDAHVLGGATGEAPHTVCPAARWYDVAMAPPMAADALGMQPIALADLVADLTPWPDGTDVGLIETAGGPRSPLAHDGDCLDLALAVQPSHAVLVADAGLGTINSVRLCLAAIGPAIVVLNRYDDTDDLHRRNLAWLTADDTTVVTTPEQLADLLLD